MGFGGLSCRWWRRRNERGGAEREVSRKRDRGAKGKGERTADDECEVESEKARLFRNYALQAWVQVNSNCFRRPSDSVSKSQEA